ncbi:hypothetical protein [Uliginosibacterium gangwonense]|uniref:hypothetical protein n=1 Tax=Uliginosibacterium gangwonense TaxID=392736 RepID=UPI00037CBD16|nr:hypothetical protein [Uliginosibacterium gangwonense]
MKELAAKWAMAVGVILTWFAEVLNSTIVFFDNHAGGVGAVVAVAGLIMTWYYKQKTYLLAKNIAEQGHFIEYSEKGGD